MYKPKRHVIRIPMPWKQVGYAIDYDEMCRGRKSFCIAWYKQYGCLHMQFGMTFKPDNVGMELRQC